MDQDTIDQGKIDRLPPAAALLCWLGRCWPFHRGRSFLLRCLARLCAPRPGLVKTSFASGTLQIVVPWDDLASRTVALFGETDADLARFLILAVRHAPSRPTLRFLDAGANLGLFSLRLAALENVHAHAFEPQPRLARLLARNVAANRLEKKITIHPVALGAESGEVQLDIPSGNSYIARINPEAAAGVPVPLRRLDGELTPGQWNEIVAFKLDVEGFESEAIEGARPLFANHIPPLAFELNTELMSERGIEPRSLRRLLESVGYVHFYALDRVLYPIENGIFVSANIVALPAGGEILREAFGFRPDFRPKPRPQWPVVTVDF